MANGFHISLPPQQTAYYSSKTKPISRRTPLTPSTITPPSVNAYTSATRRDSCGSEPSRATSLLAKVASHPSSPRRTPMTSPMSTPTQEDPSLAGIQTPRAEAYKSASRQDAAKHYWSSQRQQDGYISFPDYEKYWSSYDDVQRERSRERSSAKT